jgi:hypothetical protein
LGAPPKENFRRSDHFRHGPIRSLLCFVALPLPDQIFPKMPGFSDRHPNWTSYLSGRKSPPNKGVWSCTKMSSIWCHQI